MSSLLYQVKLIYVRLKSYEFLNLFFSSKKSCTEKSVQHRNKIIDLWSFQRISS